MALKEVLGIHPGSVPNWVDNLIVYEVNPKTFTSPDGYGDGSGSGTFKSMEQKIPYLKSLGVTGLWIAGHSKANKHFSVFWTVYAAEDPEEIDTSLGSRKDLVELVQSCHENGIHVFVDVVTHGVTFSSRIFKEHPDWFHGSEWGMADFNYDNASFRKWWISLWVNAVAEFDFDGFRLDGPNGISGFEQVMAVWDDITARCLEAGKQIVVIGENSRYHFRQYDFYEFTHNVAKDFSNSPEYCSMQISCHDEGIMMGEGNYYALRGSRFKFGYSSVFSYNIPLFMAGEEFWASQNSVPGLKKKLYNGYEQSCEIDFYDNSDGSDSGGWLLGSLIPWNEADMGYHKDMLEDCRKIIRIRNENSDLLHYNRKQTNITEVRAFPKTGSVPYIRFKYGKAAVLIGNETIEDITYSLHILVDTIGMSEFNEFILTDLYRQI